MEVRDEEIRAQLAQVNIDMADAVGAVDENQGALGLQRGNQALERHTQAGQTGDGVDDGETDALPVPRVDGARRADHLLDDGVVGERERHGHDLDLDAVALLQPGHARRDGRVEDLVAEHHVGRGVPLQVLEDGVGARRGVGHEDNLVRACACIPGLGDVQDGCGELALLLEPRREV